MGKSWLYLDKCGFIWAKGGCIWIKAVVFEQIGCIWGNWFYLSKTWLYFGKSGCLRGKVDATISYDIGNNVEDYKIIRNGHLSER